MKRAGQRATRLYRSKGFRRAYINGASAALEGLGPERCPYRRGEGWRSPWRIAWMRGHRSIATEPDEG